jgi:hypothetical protein
MYSVRIIKAENKTASATVRMAVKILKGVRFLEIVFIGYDLSGFGALK